MPKERLYVRRFLNRPYHHGSGHIRVRVEDTSGKVGSYVTPDVVFELADCSRQVSFDFGFYSESARRNSLYKARLLANVTARFVEALEREVELSRRRIKEYRRPASPKADWMVNVCTRQAVPDFTEDHFEPLAEALDTLSPALGFDTFRRTVSATLTISAVCAHDAPAIGIERFRAALAEAGLTYEGTFRATVEYEEE